MAIMNGGNFTKQRRIRYRRLNGKVWDQVNRARAGWHGEQYDVLSSGYNPTIL